MRRMLLIVSLALPLRAEAQPVCSDLPLAVQVLGSGGIFAGSGRASASYLVWREGQAIIMVGAGAGAVQRFGETGADLADLELLAIGRADPDHVADLARLLDLSASVRDRPLRLLGPEAGGAFADIVSTAGRNRPGSVDLGIVEWHGEPPGPLSADAAEVTAVNVPHAAWSDPSSQSVAYRVRVGDTTVVFGGDQNGTLHSFLDFADDAELLVMHLAISEQADEALREVHATPSIIGRIAWQAEVDRLLLGQIVDPPLDQQNRAMFSGPVLEESVREVRFRYSGPIEVAADLQCVPLT